MNQISTGLFIKQYEGKHRVVLSEDWAKSKVKQRIKECYLIIEALKKSHNPRKFTSEENQKLEYLKQSLHMFNDQERMKRFMHKAERHRQNKLRQKKIKEQVNARRKREKRMQNFMDKAIDTWQEYKSACEKEEKGISESILKKAKMTKKRTTTSCIIAKLEQLRRLRTLKKHVPYNPNQYIPTQNSNLDLEENESFSDSESSGSENDFITEHHYYQGYESIKSMVKIRCLWDRFIDRNGGGTRIPIRFISPPPNPNPLWASYVHAEVYKHTE